MVNKFEISDPQIDAEAQNEIIQAGRRYLQTPKEEIDTLIFNLEVSLAILAYISRIMEEYARYLHTLNRNQS